MKARYLIDKSALARMPIPEVARRLAPILEAGEAATCDIIDLEVLYSARNAEDYEKTRQRRALAYQSAAVTSETLKRALEVQGRLAQRGQHRIRLPDLMIAAVAEASGLVVLHYDRDYDVIAGVTGQPVEWVVERGSV